MTSGDAGRARRMLWQLRGAVLAMIALAFLAMVWHDARPGLLALIVLVGLYPVIMQADEPDPGEDVALVCERCGDPAEPEVRRGDAVLCVECALGAVGTLVTRRDYEALPGVLAVDELEAGHVRIIAEQGAGDVLSDYMVAHRPRHVRVDVVEREPFVDPRGGRR